MTTPLDEELPQPRRHRRRAPVALACGAAVAIAGGVAITAANASGTSGSGSSGSGSTGSTSASAPSGAPSNAPKPGSMPKPKPHIDGTVLSVSGTQVLVKDPEGFTRTIVTSSSTKYTNGLSASSVKKGAVIHAEGKVDANGTSLDATTIGKRPTPPAGGPGGHGPGMGPGHGRPPAPPNGTKPTGSKPTGSKPTGTTAPSGSTTSPSSATSS